jgi:hypothetical protein
MFGLNVQRIYYQYSGMTAAQVRAATIDAINNGRVIVNYVGHSSHSEWANEALFGLTGANELTSLTNLDKYPVMLPMTCFDGYFQHHDPAFSSLAESIVRLPNAGALASWSATGLGVATGHDHLNQGFFRAVVQIGIRQIGPATLIAKANLKANSSFSLDLLDTYNLLGDPASVLALPPIPHRLYLPLAASP